MRICWRGGSSIKRILVGLTLILTVLVCYLYADIWFYVQALPPPIALEQAPPLVSDKELPLYSGLEFLSIVRAKGIYSYENMLEDIRELVQQYPLLQADMIGHSVEGRPLYSLSLGRGPRRILLDGSHHGNEWVSSFLLMTMVEHYAYYYHTGQMFGSDNLRQLGEEFTFCFVPMINPDGVEIVASSGKSSNDYQQLVQYNDGSRNFSGWKANARGVDLNRQYPVNWELAKGYGPSYPARANYAGKSALTEPEAIAMHELHQKQLFAAQVSFHTVGNIVYYNYHQTGEQLTRDRSLADRVADTTGYELRDSNGGIGGMERDYVVATYRVPSLIIELGRSKGRPLPEFPSMWDRNKRVPLVIAHFLQEQTP